MRWINVMHHIYNFHDHIHLHRQDIWPLAFQIQKNFLIGDNLEYCSYNIRLSVFSWPVPSFILD